ncbi:VOC family protein [Martelella sp. AD-3]|uniref:VOC family protein n=1 Tax=Martelella sp. AD-3 TaxID=686597 RepID=UPI0004661DD9|nr:VOC family protein [Martelella sp. AD-3]AMM86136.1 lactoylglutathione lyase [Martelella sp. AD-3]|tara:strand:+ start:362 stop:760 length:399 start_codon:yes stop_codon:yes gene_type:complete
MLKGFEHVGMTVSNIDKSLNFYVDLLGLKLTVRRRGQDDSGFEFCFLDAGNGMLEIMGPATGALQAEDVAAGRAGLRHLTFCFDDIDTLYRRLEEAGVELVEAPREAYNRDIVDKVAFCRDPDGILIELCER